MNNYFITGSNGFIGSWLRDRLYCEGIPYSVGDRTGLPRPAGHIVDLATYGNIAEHKGWKEIFKANVTRVAELLNKAEGYSSMVLTSSSSCQLNAKTDYIEAKRLMEQLGLVYAKKGKPIVIIRPSTVIGIGDQPTHLIPKLIRSCLYQEPMPFVPDSMHDFINVKDVVDAIIFLSENIDKCKGKVINVSTGIGLTNKQIKEIIEGVTGRTANTFPVNSLRAHDSKDWVVDNTELLKMGWRPKFSIEKTICQMINLEKES